VPCADPETEYHGANPPGVHDVYPVEGDYDGVLRQALDRLPVRYRTLLVLMTSDLCLSYAEIADWMDMPIGSIGPMRRRALSMLENTPEFRSGRIPRPVSERSPKAGLDMAKAMPERMAAPGLIPERLPAHDRIAERRTAAERMPARPAGPRHTAPLAGHYSEPLAA
jgi:hypothetical protein